MNHIRKHIPNFIDTDRLPDENDFETTDQLLNIPWVKEWESPFDGRPFYRWSKSDNHLIAEYDNGKFWWVIGFIRNPDNIELPKWTMRKREN